MNKEENSLENSLESLITEFVNDFSKILPKISPVLLEIIKTANPEVNVGIKPDLTSKKNQNAANSTNVTETPLTYHREAIREPVPTKTNNDEEIRRLTSEIARLQSLVEARNKTIESNTTLIASLQNTIERVNEEAVYNLEKVNREAADSIEKANKRAEYWMRETDGLRRLAETLQKENAELKESTKKSEVYPSNAKLNPHSPFTLLGPGILYRSDIP